jgi:hypothetical protein
MVCFIIEYYMLCNLVHHTRLLILDKVVHAMNNSLKIFLLSMYDYNYFYYA